MKPRGTVRGRFGGFAVGHLAVSLLGAALIFLLPGGAVDGAPGLAALTAGLMLLYLPAGWAASALRGWPAPDRNTAKKAVLLPALWACGFGFLCSGACFGGGWLIGCLGLQQRPAGFLFSLLSAAALCGLTLLMSTCFWAAPSFCLMLLALGPLFQVRGALSFVLWFLCILPAGALPPLLFFLGSLLPRASQEGCSHEREKSIGAPDSPVCAPHPGPAPDGGPGRNPDGEG